MVAVIFLDPQSLPELQYSVFDSEFFLVLIGFENETLHMPKMVEINRLEHVLEDLDNLFLREPNKLEREFGNHKENLILNVLFLFTSLDPGPLGLTFIFKRH